MVSWIELESVILHEVVHEKKWLQTGSTNHICVKTL